MLIWNGETIIEVSDEAGAGMIERGDAVAVGPFDGARVFPTKEEMEASKPQRDTGNEYSTKDMSAKKRGRKGEQ